MRGKGSSLIGDVLGHGFGPGDCAEDGTAADAVVADAAAGSAAALPPVDQHPGITIRHYHTCLTFLNLSNCQVMRWRTVVELGRAVCCLVARHASTKY